MSPEQARGQSADRRSDIWAFGCVPVQNAEQASGRLRVLTSPDTLANVLKIEPDWSRLPDAVLPRVQLVLRACLQKNPKRRLGDAQSIRLALEGAFDAGPAPSPAFSVTRPTAWQRVGRSAGASLATAAVVGVAAWLLQPAVPSPPVNRFGHIVPDGQQFRFTGNQLLAVSDDGRQFAYNTADGLRLRRLGELEARVIPGTEMLLGAPFFSPDGQSVGYWQAESLKRIPISGGTPVVITAAEPPHGASWADDDTILFGQLSGIMRVPANGG